MCPTQIFIQWPIYCAINIPTRILDQVSGMPAKLIHNFLIFLRNNSPGDSLYECIIKISGEPGNFPDYRITINITQKSMGLTID